MNQSILITGGNFDDRYQKANQIALEYLSLKKEEELKTHPDFTEITPDLTVSIGIGQIRELNKNLLLKPLRAPLRVTLIAQAELMTLEAQNAFLKTLEEPPEKVVIILCTRDPQMILITLVSRCRLIMLAAKPEIELLEAEEKTLTNLLINLFQSSLGQKFIWAENFGQNKEDALLQLSKMTILGREVMLNTLRKTNEVNSEVKKYKNFLQRVGITKNYVRANVNPRFALENLFISC